MTAPLWVFGYGSLVWNPGFRYSERVKARLPGFTRTFCMRSIHHRGTPDHPGLVLALDPHPQGACEGLAFRVEAGPEHRVSLEHGRAPGRAWHRGPRPRMAGASRPGDRDLIRTTAN